ncbi:MAG: hypothetical protein HYS41_06290 [Candidatus Omnitrophica bacterium]|nr:hypothetical protein [Candidatus Omnitrophota bacterium]
MTPTLIAHRGDPQHAPENTLASFRSALAKGARAVEADLRQTADGVWVIFHDPSLKRTTGRDALLERTPWSRLKGLQAGGWFSEGFRGEPVPRLADLLIFCREQKVRLFLDLKVTGEEESLAGLLKGSGCLNRVSLGVGEISAFGRWRRLLREIPLFWVTGYEDSITPERMALAKRWRLNGFVAYRRWVTARTVKGLRAQGLEIYVWTIRNARELARFARMGVDGLMSEVWPWPPAR